MDSSLSRSPKKRGWIWLIVFLISAVIFVASLVGHFHGQVLSRDTVRPLREERILPGHIPGHPTVRPPVSPTTESQSGSGNISATTVVSFIAALASLIASITAWRKENRERREKSFVDPKR